MYTGNQTFQDFNVIGFEHVRSSIPVNPQDPSSLAAATYTGLLSLPYPPFQLSGNYNSTSSNVVFGKAFSLPFGGLHLAYSVSVRLDILQIVERLFHGELAEPLRINLTGVYNVIDCLVDLSGSVYILSEDVDVDAGLVLELCDNCSRICSARAVSFSVALSRPWNVSLNGSYALSNNITSVALGGSVSILGYNIDVFTTVKSSAGAVNLTVLRLRMQLPDPINVTVEGQYSRDMGIATLSARLSLQQIMFSLSLIANIENRSLSELTFSGDLTVPFAIMLSGSYALTPKTSFVSVRGQLRIERLLDLTVAARAHLDTRSLSNFTLTGMLSIGSFRIATMARYDVLPSSSLDLSGSISIQGGTHAVMVGAKVNTSAHPVSIQEISIRGVFPPPLDFVSFVGTYSQSCSCALLQGSLNRDIFNLTLFTNLTFQDQSREIRSLQVQVSFHRPLNLVLVGQYLYGSNSSMGLISARGMFDIPQVINFDTELDLVLQGMDPVLSRLHFVGTFPPPLSFQVMGDYNCSTNDVTLMGNLRYNFAQFQASSMYRFMDDVHNVSAMFVDLRLAGMLTHPFVLAVEGSYIFSTETFALSSKLQIGNYVDLSVDVSLNTSVTPVSISLISFVGTFKTAIKFNGEFRGDFDTVSSKVELMSSLHIGPIQFMATANLSYSNQTKTFSISSARIYGMTSSPLSLYVEGNYIPGNITTLSLHGNISVNFITFMGTVFAETDPATNLTAIIMMDFICSIDDPFHIMLKGSYNSGDLLTVIGSVTGIPEITLQASITLNLTEMPRRIDSVHFIAQLSPPLSGRLTADYVLSSGELVLNGVSDIGSLMFMAQVVISTNTTPVAVQSIRLMTTFAPLSLHLVGEYSRGMQQISFMGMINIPSPPINLTAASYIDLSGNSSQLSVLTITANFSQPSLNLSGEYNATSQDAFLVGTLSFPLANLQISACALLHLGMQKMLESATIALDFTIPFGNMSTLRFEGTYDYATTLIAVIGRIIRSKRSLKTDQFGANDSAQYVLHRSTRSTRTQSVLGSSTYALLLLSTNSSPTIQVIALRFPDLDVGNLMRTYLGISWPADNFPIMFRDLAVYTAYVNITHNQTAYREGYHARGLVKFFVFPTILLEVSLVQTPVRRLEASLALQNAVDWGFFVLCGGSDPTCTVMGPSLSIEVGSGRNTLKFEGGFSLFGIYVGMVDLFVSKTNFNACLTLSAEVTRNLPGLVPSTIKMFWNDHGFYINLPIPNLQIPDFKLNDIRSRGICQAIGGIISELAINAPLHINTDFVSNRLDNGTISLGVIFSGYVELQIVGSSVLNVTIKPIAFSASLAPSTRISWSSFRSLIQQAIVDHRAEIVDDILGNAKAAATLLGSKLVKVSVGQLAQFICRELLAAAVEGVVTGAVGVAGALGTGILTSINLIFGQGSGGSDDDDNNNNGGIANLYTCDNGYNGWCDHNCTFRNNMILCSCLDGYLLQADGTSCISECFHYSMDSIACMRQRKNSHY